MNKVTVDPINSTATVCYSATTVLFVPLFCTTREMCKKKKKCENADAAKFSTIQTAPKSTKI